MMTAAVVLILYALFVLLPISCIWPDAIPQGLFNIALITSWGATITGIILQIFTTLAMNSIDNSLRGPVDMTEAMPIAEKYAKHPSATERVLATLFFLFTCTTAAVLVWHGWVVLPIFMIMTVIGTLITGVFRDILRTTCLEIRQKE